MQFLLPIHFFAFAVLASLFCAPAYAQDDLEPVKMDITGRILEYQQLQQENSRLKSEFEDLKIQYDQRLKQLQLSANDEQIKMAALQHRIDARKESRKSVEEWDADLSIRRAQITHLKLALMDLQEQERLWKLKIAESEYRKQTLELDFSLKNSRHEEQAGLYFRKMEQLNREILRSRLAEKELLVQYSMLEDEANILAQQRKIFENENAYLAKESVTYKDLVNKTQQESQSLMQALADEQKKFDEAIQQKQKQKDELQQKLAVLQEQRQALDAQLTQTLQNLEVREQLMADIARLKTENDRLESAIARLSAQAQQVVP